jgi:hypothetical protein
MDAISELKAEWKRVDRALIPEKLLGEMPQPECNGLTFLTDVMINATVCRLGPDQGQVTARYADDIELVLDVAETIELGLKNSIKSGRAPRQLVLSAQSTLTREKMDVCVVAKGMSVPAIDDCVAFVMWAEAGFIDPPFTVVDGILYVRDPELYERKKREGRLARQEQRRIEKERSDLEICQRRARYQAQQDLELEHQRIRNLGWRELMTEHETAKNPSNEIEAAAFASRQELLGFE